MGKEQMEYVRVDDTNNIRTIRLSRENKMNALNFDFINELEKIFYESKYDDDVRVIILKGDGKTFCAGDDLKGMATEKRPLPDSHIKRAELGYARLIRELRNLDKPIIAQVHGYALGAGFDLVLACDLIYAEENTVFGLPFAKRGLVSGSTLLPDLIGYHKACNILFFGENISVNEAYELGLVNEVKSINELDSFTEKKANALANAPTAAIGLIKRAINDGIGNTLDEKINQHFKSVASSYSTHDYEEGKLAFKEKREPRYLGK